MTLQPIDFEATSAEELLRWSMNKYGLEAGLASSFGLEDMVLIDMIVKLDGPLTIFTLDTGRLHEETYELIEAIEEDDTAIIKEELGDLMLHVLFQAEIAYEKSQFTLEDSLNNICNK